MSADLTHPIRDHESVELAEIAGYYVRRNHDARRLLSHAATFPDVVGPDGWSVMHYETLIVRRCEPVADSRMVRLHPALPINGADTALASEPVTMCPHDGFEPRPGHIALLQRAGAAVGHVLFFDELTMLGGAKMGYPMTYSRVVFRNGLTGNYGESGDDVANENIRRLRCIIAGDMRRLEVDTLDPWHLAQYAAAADIAVEQAEIVLRTFLSGAILKPSERTRFRERYSHEDEAALKARVDERQRSLNYHLPGGGEQYTHSKYKDWR